MPQKDRRFRGPAALISGLTLLLALPAAVVQAQTPAEDLDAKWVAICAGATPGSDLADRCAEILNAGPGGGDRRSDAALGNNLGLAAAAGRNAAVEGEAGVVRVHGAWSLFVSAGREESDRDADRFENGFEGETDSLLLGVDRRFGPRWVGGIAARFGEAETRFDANAGSLDSETFAATLFWGYSTESGHRFDSFAGIGSIDYDSARLIDYTLVLDAGLPTESTVTIAGTGRGATDGDQVFAGTSWNYSYGQGSWEFGPQIGADYLRTEIDGYAESDDVGLALAYDSQEITSLQAKAGLELAGSISRGWGVFSPQFRVTAMHEFDDDARTIVSRFVGDVGATPILVNTATPDRDFAEFGASVSFLFKRGIVLFVDASQSVGHDFLDNRSYAAGLRFELGGK